MLKSDRWIRKMSKEHDMINPFSEKQVREGVISYGLSSYGYDLRVADEFKIFTNVNNALVDPKRFDEKSFVTVQTDACIVPPNSFALALLCCNSASPWPTSTMIAVRARAWYFSWESLTHRVESSPPE